ncbi:hypothetical protein J2S47_000003 [Streptomyces griseoviridis]|uniref:Uncharacterized protein n=1 Tax=Streptomyces griseoviridis TaxID=45398 RepID=A0ABT9L719_STRGD|nr:hypothetical protein [Streptomyces griseoviridis]
MLVVREEAEGGSACQVELAVRVSALGLFRRSGPGCRGSVFPMGWEGGS